MAETHTMTDAELLAAYDGELCLVCGGSKRLHTAFCLTDFLALTVFVRNELYRGPGGSQFCEAFRSALAHLRLNPVRRRHYSSGTGGWSYQTSDELEAAGYRFQEHAYCRVPGCNQAIMWYWGPDLRKIPINLVDNQPHRTTCVDPEWRPTPPVLKTSALRRRRVS